MRSVPWRPLVLLLLALSPMVVLAALLADPRRNTPAATAGHLRDGGVELRSLGEAQVRGKSEALSIFTLD